MEDFGKIITGLIMAIIYFWLNSRKKAKSTGKPGQMRSPEQIKVEDERLPQLSEEEEANSAYSLEDVLREFDEKNIRRQKKKEEAAKQLIATPMIREITTLDEQKGEPSKYATDFFNIEEETRRHIVKNTPKHEPRPETWAEKIQDPKLLVEMMVMKEILDKPISMRDNG